MSSINDDELQISAYSSCSSITRSDSTYSFSSQSLALSVLSEDSKDDFDTDSLDLDASSSALIQETCERPTFTPFIILILIALIVTICTTVIQSILISNTTGITDLAPPCHVIEQAEPMLPCALASNIDRLLAPIQTRASEAFEGKWFQPMQSPPPNPLPDVQPLQDLWWHNSISVKKAGSMVAGWTNVDSDIVGSKQSNILYFIQRQLDLMERMIQTRSMCDNRRFFDLQLLIGCWTVTSDHHTISEYFKAIFYAFRTFNISPSYGLAPSWEILEAALFESYRSTSMLVHGISVHYDSSNLTQATNTLRPLLESIRHASLQSSILHGTLTCVRVIRDIRETMLATIKSEALNEAMSIDCGSNNLTSLEMPETTHSAYDTTDHDLDMATQMLMRNVSHRWAKNLDFLLSRNINIGTKDCARSWMSSRFAHCDPQNISCDPLHSFTHLAFSSYDAYISSTNDSQWCTTDPNYGCKTHPLPLVRWYFSAEWDFSANITADTPNWPGVLDGRRRQKDRTIGFDAFIARLYKVAKKWDNIHAWALQVQTNRAF